MRVAIVVIVLLAAGCTSALETVDAPVTTTPTVSSEACASASLSVEPPTLRWGEEVTFILRTSACDDPLVFASSSDCEELARQASLVIRRGDEVAYLWEAERAFEVPRPSGCEDGVTPGAIPPVPPGVTRLDEFLWDATIGSECSPDPSCIGGYARYADLGVYDVSVERSLANGSALRASTSVEVAPGEPPPFSEASAIRLVLPASATVGEMIEVKAENRGDVAVAYNTFYTACAVQYHRDDGRRFLIPPGTHCDLINEEPIAPGETVTLFSWDLSECVKDPWGCAESQPLAPGRYHLRWTYAAYGDGAGPSGTAGASIGVRG